MKHDILTNAMIERAIKKAADDKAKEQQKRVEAARELQELQRRGEYLQMERQIIHEAQQTIKGIETAIMAHFGNKE